MKQNVLLISVLCLAVSASAQYVPNNSQTFQFISLYNPGFTGVENFDDLKLGYRYQWAGFGEYSPKFVNLAFHTRVKQPLDLTYNSIRLSDVSGGRPEQLPRGKRIIHGLGANVFQSKIGVVSSIGGGLSYAINYPVTENTRLSIGATALMENRKLDVSAVSVRDPDEFYDYLLRSSTTQTDLNVRAGVLLYGENFYLGVSYLPIINVAVQSSELAMDEPFYRASFQAGVALPVNSEVTLKPSIIGLVQMNNDFVIDYNLKAFIQNKIWLGLSYRDVESGVALLGFNINDRFTVSYSFELSVGDFRRFDDGSHELVLAARLNNIKRFTQYIW